MSKERLRVPIAGGGIGEYPYSPKYSDDGGVIGFEMSDYDRENDTVEADFETDTQAIMDSIIAEDDVSVVG